MQKISLYINGTKIVCVKKCAKEPKGNTLIILEGATTIDVTYYALAYALKGVDVIMVNAPEHGKLNKSSGGAITDADTLIRFHANVILKLVEGGYATPKVDVCGYSLGGMSLVNILNQGNLDSIIENAIILCSYRNMYRDLVYVKSLYDVKANTFNGKVLLRKLLTNKSPKILKYLPTAPLTANANSCISDFLICESMHRLERKIPLRVNIETNIVAIIGDSDYFFDSDSVKEWSNVFKNFKYIEVCNGHMLPVEAPFKTAKLIKDGLANFNN